ncbi:protein of unknown function [Pseudomonas sp. JV241A]|nr:protein of unknown function [Pseudomonas sp. JV241A]
MPVCTPRSRTCGARPRPDHYTALTNFPNRLAFLRIAPGLLFLAWGVFLSAAYKWNPGDALESVLVHL